MPKVFTEDYGVEEALADYLGIEPDEVHYADYDRFGIPVFETDNGEEYIVTDDYDEVENACYEEVQSLLDDCGISGFNVSLDEVVDTSWFEDAMREDYEFYVDDIRNEKASDPMFDNRLEEEMDRAGCDTEEEYVDQLCSDYSDPVKWYEDNFGKDSLNDVVNKNGLVDVQKLTDVCVNTDGAGNLLASYDGDEIEFEYEGQTFWAYRID